MRTSPTGTSGRIATTARHTFRIPSSTRSRGGPKTPRSRIPEALKATEPDVDWIALARLGNLLRHEYQRVDPVLLWTLLTL